MFSNMDAWGMAGHEILETRCSPTWMHREWLGTCSHAQRMAGHETMETRCSLTWVHREWLGMRL